MQQCYLPIPGGWIGGCQGISTCQWAMQHLSPLLQLQFITFEVYCPLPFCSVAPNVHHAMCDFSQTTSLLVDACFHIHQSADTEFAIPRWGAQWVLGLSQGPPGGNIGLR